MDLVVGDRVEGKVVVKVGIRISPSYPQYLGVMRQTSFL